MRAVRVSPGEYGQIFHSPSHLYNSVAFNELNRHKCDDIHYVTLCDDRGRVRFGIILGQKGDVLKSPFSAPFGGIEANGRQKAAQYVEAAGALAGYWAGEMRITLPPLVYDCDAHVSKQLLALQSCGGRVDYCDYNYHFCLAHFDDGYRARLDCKVRNTLTVSMAQGFEVEATTSASPDAIRDAHAVIAVNHSEHGYPLHMSADDVIGTSHIIPVDTFVIRKDSEAVASAIVYHNTPRSLQLIYWGDIAAARSMRPMNFLAYSIFAHYHESMPDGIFDLGPSSSDGIPAIGLCNFKEGLGCTVTPKASVIL